MPNSAPKTAQEPSNSTAQPYVVKAGDLTWRHLGQWVRVESRDKMCGVAGQLTQVRHKYKAQPCLWIEIMPANVVKMWFNESEPITIHSIRPVETTS